LLHILRRGLFSHFSPSTFLLLLTKKILKEKIEKKTITYVPENFAKIFSKEEEEEKSHNRTGQT